MHQAKPSSRAGAAVQITLALVLLLSNEAISSTEIVRSSAPVRPPRTLNLEEIWRVGGDDSEVILGMPVDSAIDADGNVYILDNQLCRVEVFGNDGSHLRTIGRRGEGPGEFRMPIAMTFLPDDILGILELIPARLVMVERNGAPAGNVTFGGDDGAQTGFHFAVDCQYRSGVILQAGMHSSPHPRGQRRTHFLSRFTAAGREMARYSETSTVLSFSPAVFDEEEVLPAFWFGHAVGPDGRVYAATSRDDYKINVFSPEGEHVLTIERDFENRQRDDRALRRMQAMVDTWYDEFPGDVATRFAKHEPTISELYVDGQGVLWVEHSRSGIDQAPGILLTYDTFDRQGNYLQQVSIAAEGDPFFDGIRFLGGQNALVIKGYRLSRWSSLSPAGRADFGEDSGPIEIIFCKIGE